MSYAPLTSIPFLNRLTETENLPASNGHTPRRKPSPKLQRTSKPRTDYPLIVHCHLCWDWVWQRPQQFMSRLSQKHRVLFVETMAPDENLVTPLVQLRRFEKWPNLTLLRLQFPSWRWNNGEWVDRERRRLVKRAL